ncbi:MAG: ChbG/HpnK family deacetylase [Longimicrobiales bacterium]
MKIPERSFRRLLPIAAIALAGCGSARERPAFNLRAATADTVYLLVRSDDAGMTHAVSMANQQLIEAGMPVSVSIMFATPWWQEVAEILRGHPQVSVGIHLTLNSEWRNYRWGPVIGQNAAPTLVDDDGFFFHSSQDLYDNDPDLGEVELELRAQIERAVDTGLQIDYMDFHMGTVRNRPEFLEIARRLAAEYRLLMSGFHGEVTWDPQYRAAPEDKPDSLAAMVPRLDSRFNVLITHPGLATPEMVALEDMNASNPLENMGTHRQAELDALLSARFARALQRSRVELITYRDLGAMLARDSLAGRTLRPAPQPAAAGNR